MRSISQEVEVAMTTEERIQSFAAFVEVPIEVVEFALERAYFENSDFVDADETVINDLLEEWNNFYQGIFGSRIEWAKDLTEDIYGWEDFPPFIIRNINWEGIADDLEKDYDLFEHHCDIYVFRSN